MECQHATPKGVSQNGTVACAACGNHVSTRDKAGEIRITITVKPGVSVAVVDPICVTCSRKATYGPESALNILRCACPNMLDGGR